MGSCSPCGQEIKWVLGRSGGTALEATEIQELCKEGGEELVFREPFVWEKAMEEAFGLKIFKNETTEVSTGRSRLLFARLQSEGVNCHQKQGATSCCEDADSEAWVGTNRSWDFDEVCTAIRTSFPATWKQTMTAMAQRKTRSGVGNKGVPTAKRRAICQERPEARSGKTGRSHTAGIVQRNAPKDQEVLVCDLSHATRNRRRPPMSCQLTIRCWRSW